MKATSSSEAKDKIAGAGRIARGVRAREIMQMKKLMKALAVTALVAAPALAQAQSVEDFYKGQKISWILSAGEGGGYSTYARFFAPAVLGRRFPARRPSSSRTCPAAAAFAR